MNSNDFALVLDGQETLCEDTLLIKAVEYADDVDRLQTFKIAASLQGITPKQALAGMMAKHSVSIYDMIASDETYSLDKWSEKITDHINYLILLKALIIEESSEMSTDIPIPNLLHYFKGVQDAEDD